MGFFDRRDNLAGAIYGTVLVTAVEVGEWADPNVTPLEGVISLLVTTLVFWIAHVYADTVAARFHEGRRSWHLEFVDKAAHEWPLVESGVPAMLALLLGALGVLSRNTAFALAAWMGVASLFVWGLVIARREHARLRMVLLTGVVNALFGLAIVGLKLLIE